MDASERSRLVRLQSLIADAKELEKDFKALEGSKQVMAYSLVASARHALEEAKTAFLQKDTGTFRSPGSSDTWRFELPPKKDPRGDE